MSEQFDKYFTGTLTDAEKLDLFRHMDSDKALKDEFADLQNVMAISGLLDKDDDDQMVSRKIKELKQRAGQRTHRRISYTVLKYATVAVLLICTWFISQQYMLQKSEDYSTWVEAPKGQRVCITLADGSEAWLSSRSKIKIPNHFKTNERVVELDGEGFFTVTPDAQKPFIVKTKQCDIQVFGTQFNVFAYSESPRFETELVEGSVYVYNKGDYAGGMYLKPDEKVILENNKLTKQASTFHQSKHLKNGIFSFEDKPFGDLLNRLELWYNVKFIVASPAIRTYAFSGKFRQSDDIGSILQAIKEVGMFKYRIVSEHEIEIY